MGLELTLLPALLLGGLAVDGLGLGPAWVRLGAAALGAAWLAYRIPGSLRRFRDLRRCPACEGPLPMRATACEACGEDLGPRPVPPGGGRQWAPPAFLARPLPEVEARAGSLRRRRLAGLAATVGAALAVVLWDEKLMIPAILLGIVGVVTAALSQRCPACDLPLVTLKGQSASAHCPNCTWPLAADAAEVSGAQPLA